MRLAVLVLSPLLLSAFGQQSEARRPIWAKHAVGLTLDCIGGGRQPEQRIVAPDRLTAVVVSCRKNTPDDEILLVRVTDPGGRTQVVALDLAPDWRPSELLWSPRSNAFAVNGAETSYSGFAFMTYDLARGVVHRVELARPAQRAMAAQLTPCHVPIRPERCEELEANPDFNMTVITWTRGSEALVLLDHVTASSSYGSIMGKVAGYEIDSRSGRVLTRLTPTRLRQKWGHEMAFRPEIMTGR